MKSTVLSVALAAFSCSAITLASTRNQTSNSTVSIPYEYTYLLPDGFTGSADPTFVNSTHVPANASNGNEINGLLTAASRAPFISYSQEFSDLLGHNPDIRLVQDRTASNDAFAYEAGVWVPERNEVWFTSAPQQVSKGRPSTVYSLDLSSGNIGVLNVTKGALPDCNGGVYFEGKVYFATYPSNETCRGGILSVDVHTLEVETVVNSYFGQHFNGPDDVVWVTNPKNHSERYMFFTDLDFTSIPYPKTYPKPQLVANGVYRWDPQEGILLPVISQNEVRPNGIRVSPDQKTLYVTDGDITNSSVTNLLGTSSWLGPYIYKYTLDEDMLPTNRRLLGQAREGIADGIHVDKKGRVWTGESEGIVVRSPKGKVLGVVNPQYFEANKEGLEPIANFALAGDTLVVLAVTRLWTVKLAENVTGNGWTS